MLKSTCFKWTYGLSGKDYRIVTLSKSYLAIKEIIKQSLKSMGHTNLTKGSNCYGRTDFNYRKTSL